MCDIERSMERRLRAMLLSSPGAKPMVDLVKDFESLFPDLPQPTLTALKTMDNVVKVEYSDDLGDFLVTLIDADADDSMSKSTDENANHSDIDDVSGSGDTGFGPLTEDQLATLKPDRNGLYTLCFPKRRNYFMRPQMIRDKFLPYKITSYSITAWYVFVRFSSRETALDVLQKFRSKMDIRPAHRRNPQEGKYKNHTDLQKTPNRGEGSQVKQLEDKMATMMKASPAKSDDNNKPDVKRALDEYRKENERKLSHVQQELFTVNHKLQDMVVESAKNHVALQNRIAAQDDKITKLLFTVHSLQDALQRTQAYLPQDTPDVDK